MLVSGSKSPFSSKVLTGQDIIEHGSLGFQVHPKFGLCLKLRLIKIYLLRPVYIVFHANKKKLHTIESKNFESEFNLEKEFK